MSLQSTALGGDGNDGPREGTPTHGSRTMVIEQVASAEAPPPAADEEPAQEDPAVVGHIDLRGGPLFVGHVTWDESVVDNEGLGRKKSKICCIYRKARDWDESDSDSSDFSSDDDSDSDDSDSGHGSPSNDHEHHHSCRHHRGLPGPNAYERQPRYKKRAGPPPPSAGPSGGGDAAPSEP
ncbi:Type 1 phosphatases regulator ypi1 [Allomyces arbusculus]|nr:Type 1 phosphatases regulator ypi1 [Allomyces arbusculus]